MRYGYHHRMIIIINSKYSSRFRSTYVQQDNFPYVIEQLL